MAPRKAAKPRAALKATKAAPKQRGKATAKKKVATASPPAKAPAGKERVVLPMSFYAKNKDAVKAPFKALGMKWSFLGQDAETTRGRYVGKNVRAYVEYTAEHADFTVEGSDAKALAHILVAWADFPKVEAAAAPPAPSPGQRELAREVAIWEFARPARHPGEPGSFYRLRVRDWDARDPRKRPVRVEP